MYWPDTQTGVDVEPARKPVASAVRKFFTEGGLGQAPTVPGGDWFNQITNELLNVLAAAGIDPSKADDDQLLKAIQALSAASLTLEGVLEDVPSWDDVPAYKDGGPSGEMNAQALALAARTEFLKARGDGYTYASIRAYTGSETRLYCSGRANIFDLAYGPFVRYDGDTTSADNDIDVLVDALGRRWKRPIIGPVFPEWAGAKGDGVADDAPAFNAVIALGRSVECPGVKYLLASEVNLLEPFDFNGGNAQFVVNHDGTGFHIMSSTYANKLNINTFKDLNFIPGTITPDSYIKIGVQEVLEPTNIDLNGLHFKATIATTAHIINERGYGLKVNNSAFNEVWGTCILFKGGVGSDESVYSYNCYVNQVDITGTDYGIVVEGGKVQIRDSIIESCRQRGIWSKGLSYNPSIYMDNVYFENNNYSLYFEGQQPQGYTLNSSMENCFFATNSGKLYASASNSIRLCNNKGFKFDKVEGDGTWSLAGSQYNIQYNPNNCPTSRIKFESPLTTSYDIVTLNTRKVVPFFNLKKKASGRLNTALKVTIVRDSGGIVTYWQGVLYAHDVNGMTWRSVQIVDDSHNGIVAAPTFEKNPNDAADMNLYFYYPQNATTLITVEGEGGFG